ncbi:MAG: hypothetical protein H7308_08245 [Chthonomonadaceae bacterium]|nr:hypothetical protein [Chthonomonadaceae bacterium]
MKPFPGNSIERATKDAFQITMWEYEQMWTQNESEFPGEELFLAGERVKAGTYRQIGGSREVRLEREDVLPASLDGRVACYLRVYPWGQALMTTKRAVQSETQVVS